MTPSALLSSLGDLHSNSSTVELVRWALNDFASQFGTECTIWTQYDPEGCLSAAMLGEQTDPGVWQYAPIIERHLPEHPIFAVAAQTSSAIVTIKTTDITSQRLLDETPLFRDAYRHMGCRYHLGLLLEGPGLPRCTLAIGRNGSDYTPAQVAALRESSGHFLNALMRLRRIETLENQLAGAGALRFHALRSKGGWFYSYTDAHTRHEIETCFGKANEGFMLPATISCLLETGQTTAPLADRQGWPWKLRVSHRRQNEVSILLEPEPLQRLAATTPSLSRREVEVAYWLCEGKSNYEIGIILGISMRTTEKHLSNIFRKIGTESRVATVQQLIPALYKAIA